MIEIVLVIAAVAGAFWCFFKLLQWLDEKTGFRREMGWFEFQKRRNRIQTLLPSEQKRTDEPR